jgi:methionyl-tRNA formyltransferase
VRVFFAGSPRIAVLSLETLARMDSAGLVEFAGVLTNPDSVKGRRGVMESTPVGAAAEKLGVRVFKPEKLDAAVREGVSALKPDLLISFAYGRIFGPKFLSLFPLGGINIHPSLLPRYRGASPIPAAILNREKETGISVQRLAAEMDSGDVLVQEAVPLSAGETTESLSGIVSAKAAELLPPLLDSLARGSVRGKPQDPGQASYCSVISKDDGFIDWTRGALEIDAQIRAYTPWPLSWTFHGDRRLYILEACAPREAAREAAPGTVLGIDKRHGILIQTGDGVLAARLLQYQAKKPLRWKDFQNGARGFIGSALGASRPEFRGAERKG